jgi:hypothetical protein
MTNFEKSKKMKQKEFPLEARFFLAMRMTEILKESAHAISATREQLLWPHDDGDIIVDFAAKCITCMGSDYSPMLLSKLIDVCEHFEIELNIHSCECPTCTAMRNQYN